jgi:RNA polymerase sigma-70 factor (ECF subfamily)
MSKDFTEINRLTNLEIQRIADSMVDGTATEKDRNRLATIIYPKLQFHIKNILKSNPHHTEEVLHYTIEKIFRCFYQYNNQWKFNTWIYTIARNESLAYLKDLKKAQTTDIEVVTHLFDNVDDSSDVKERETQTSELYQLTIRTIQSMDDGIEKAILVDRELNNMKCAEISEKHNMNLNTVKTKLRKARRTVRENLLRNNPQFLEIIKQLA